MHGGKADQLLALLAVMDDDEVEGVPVRVTHVDSQTAGHDQAIERLAADEWEFSAEQERLKLQREQEETAACVAAEEYFAHMQLCARSGKIQRFSML